MDLTTLFTPHKIGSVNIKNRFVRSATWLAKATEDGYVTEELIKWYKELAEGGAGLIISGYIAVAPAGAATHRMTRICDDSYISGQTKLVKEVHESSDVKIAAQIAHTGSYIFNKNFEPVGPSPLMNSFFKRYCRELTTEEIRIIIKKFVEAGYRAYQSGYDMVQIHGAHSYLLSDFVSPYSNQRTDEYGGDTVKRTKILVDIYNQLRDKVGKDFPILIKLNTKDYLENGLTLEEGQKIAEILINTGYDAIEPSSGRYDFKFTGRKSYAVVVFNDPGEGNYFLPNAKILKPVMKGRPIILQGGVRDPFKAEKFLQEGTADFISMSRPLIYEPNLPNRWNSGDLSLPLCTNCNACINVGGNDTVYCVVKNKKSDN